MLTRRHFIVATTNGYRLFNSSHNVTSHELNVTIPIEQMSPWQFFRFLKHLKQEDKQNFIRDREVLDKIATTAIQTLKQTDVAIDIIKSLSWLVPIGEVPRQLSGVGKTFSQRVVDGHITIPLSSSFVEILVSLARLDAKSVSLCQYVIKELPNHIPNLNPFNCLLTLRALFDLNITEYHLNKMIRDRMVETIDSFMSRDAIETLSVFAHINGPVHNGILKKCKQHLEKDGLSIDTDSLLISVDALIRLQTSIPTTLFEHLRERVSSMNGPQLVQTLRTCVYSYVNTEIAIDVLTILESQPQEKEVHVKASMAYAICNFDLKGKYSPLRMFDILTLCSDKKSLLHSLIRSILELQCYET